MPPAGRWFRAAVNVLRVDPKQALGLFPIYVDDADGWERRTLVFPGERGELEYGIDFGERMVVLYRLHWGRAD